MSISESRRKKLELLMRSLAQTPSVGGAELLAARGHSGVNRGPQPVGAELAVRQPPAPRPLTEACPGVEVATETAEGPVCHWLVRTALPAADEQGKPVSRLYREVLAGARQNFDELAASPALCHVANARPEELLFMDIETCGLGGTMIFLVGVMFHEGEGLVCEQYFARDYSEEPAILRAFASRYADSRVLVTFNGKAFDMTQIRERWAVHRMEPPWQEPPHLDLLHEARKRWKGQLPNCRLQTLERHFCGRLRTGDIPGSAIPEAYHDFVRTQDARRVADILSHNLLDLLSMAQLLTVMLTGCEPSGEQGP
jgi:uncharacterized protein YprB with RNaseH-like and TPR domain